MNDQCPCQSWNRDLCVAILLAFFFISGCNHHPVVSSPESQVLIQRFYTACNTRSVDRLSAAVKIYDQLKGSSKVLEAESKIFDQIIHLAREDRWEEAAETSIQFAEGQVNRW